MSDQIMCDLCGRGPFKNFAGLNGHRRWKHEGSPVPAYGREVPAPAAVAMAVPGGEVAASRRDLQELAAAIKEILSEMDEAIVRELAEVKELVGTTMGQHPAGVCMERGCLTCREQVGNIYAQGWDAMDARYRGISGVKEAIESYELMNTPLAQLDEPAPKRFSLSAK